jgi:hypothetical protein
MRRPGQSPSVTDRYEDEQRAAGAGISDEVDAQNHLAMLRIDAQDWAITVGNGSTQR